MSWALSDGWISSHLFSPWQIDVNIILLIWLNENVGLRYVSFHHEYLARLKFSAAKILHIIITVFAPSNFNYWCANTSANCYAAQIIWSISKTFLHISLICPRLIRFFFVYKTLEWLLLRAAEMRRCARDFAAVFSINALQK